MYRIIDGSGHEITEPGNVSDRSPLFSGLQPEFKSIDRIEQPVSPSVNAVVEFSADPLESLNGNTGFLDLQQALLFLGIFTKGLQHSSVQESRKQVVVG